MTDRPISLRPLRVIWWLHGILYAAVIVGTLQGPEAALLLEAPILWIATAASSVIVWRSSTRGAAVLLLLAGTHSALTAIELNLARDTLGTIVGMLALLLPIVSTVYALRLQARP